MKSLQSGEVGFDPTKAIPSRLRTTREMRRILKIAHQKPLGRKPKMVEVDGEERTLREWAELFEIDYNRLYYFYHRRKLRGRKLIDTARTYKPRKPSF